jgi:hypothetical protein
LGAFVIGTKTKSSQIEKEKEKHSISVLFSNKEAPSKGAQSRGIYEGL